MLEALTPEYLTARVRFAGARQKAKAAEGRAPMMKAQNADHAAEVAEILRTSRYPGGPKLITAAQALARGGGSGFEIVYKRCSTHDGHTCEHDATMAPFGAEAIEEAERQTTKAKAALTRAEKALTTTDSTLDVVAACAEVGARYCWWPASRFVDPTRFRYRGKPITDDELADLGPLELQRLITLGEVVDVSP